MAEIKTLRPEIEMREIRIEVPDAVVDWLGREEVQRGLRRAAELAREAPARATAGTPEDLRATFRKVSETALPAMEAARSQAGPALQRAREAAAPRIRQGVEAARPRVQRGAEATLEAGMAAREQAGPLMEQLVQRASGVAEQVRERAPQAAAEARERAQEEWVPAARKMARRARPVVGRGIQARATTSASAASQLGEGVQSVTARAQQAVGDATSATISAVLGFSRMTFWFGVVVWLLIRLFRPEKEQRQALYRKVRDVTGIGM